jgi:hypothetical protein
MTISRFRLVDGDEGFYLMAARLVGHGKLPYHDFLWTQMPLMPYVYALWMHLAGMTWISARALSALLAALLGTVLYSEVTKQTGRWAAGASAVLLFVTSTDIWGWFTIVKTYALSTLLLFLAYRIVVRCADGPSRWWIAGGVCLGASADARLYFAGLLPVFVWWIARHAPTGVRAPVLVRFIGGFTLAVMPNLYLLVRDPQAYFFGNLGFHAIRSSESLIEGLHDKIDTISQLVLPGGEGNGVQMALLLLLTLPFLIRPRTATAAERLALTIALVLGFICLLPTPAYVQYFCATIPFFIVSAVCGIDKLIDNLPDGRKKGSLVALCGLLVLIFAGSAIPDYRRFLITGDGVSGIDTDTVSNWRIPAITAVSQAIDRRIQPAERVLSLWPGYIFQSQADPFAGLENNSGTYLADGLSPEQQARYHILSPTRILADIAAREPRLVVVGNQESMLVDPEPYEDMLAASGYNVAAKIGDTRLWMPAH